VSILRAEVIELRLRIHPDQVKLDLMHSRLKEAAGEIKEARDRNLKDKLNCGTDYNFALRLSLDILRKYFPEELKEE
jgi:hypothetical protein